MATILGPRSGVNCKRLLGGLPLSYPFRGCKNGGSMRARRPELCSATQQFGSDSAVRCGADLTPPERLPAIRRSGAVFRAFSLILACFCGDRVLTVLPPLSSYCLLLVPSMPTPNTQTSFGCANDPLTSGTTIDENLIAISCEQPFANLLTEDIITLLQCSIDRGSVCTAPSMPQHFCHTWVRTTLRFCACDDSRANLTLKVGHQMRIVIPDIGREYVVFVVIHSVSPSC